MWLFIALQIILLSFGYCVIDLPQSIPKCRIDDPKVGNCIINVSNKLRPRFHDGINEIGIPSYNPLVLSEFILSQESDMMNFSGTFKNYSIRGLDNYDITELRYDPETMTFKGIFEVDSLATEGVYEITGKMLFIPLEGSGIWYQSLGNIKLTFEIVGEMSRRRNLDYYNPKNVKINLEIGDMVTRFDGLFNGNKALGDTTNELINRNSKLILEAAMPTIEALCEQFIMRYLKWLTKKYPYYRLFEHHS